jgi:hypothetical protein
MTPHFTRNLKRLALLVTALALLPLPALAQGMSGGDLAQIYYITPKDGHGYDLEEGMKRHMAVVGEMGNPSPWMVWEVMTGDDMGSYVVGTFGHEWADFDMQPDNPMQAQMSFMRNVQPHVAEATGGFWTFREDLSPGSTDGGEPDRFLQVYHYMPKMGGMMAVEAGFTQVKEAAEAAGWPHANWMVYQLLNGGQLPHYAIVLPGNAMADFAEPEPTMWEMMVSQMGEEGAMAMFQGFSEALAAETSEMLAFRMDLSYMPDGM